MKKALMSATLGLSVIATSLGISASASAYTLVNYATLYNQYPQKQSCLALKAGTANDGQPFIVYHCDGTASQAFSNSIYPGFSVTSPSVGVSSPIWNQAGNHQGVSVGNDATNDGAPVVLWSEFFTSSPGQFWRPDATNSPASGCYRFINPNSGKALGAAGGSMADGTAVIIWADSWKNPVTHPDQYWCVR